MLDRLKKKQDRPKRLWILAVVALIAALISIGTRVYISYMGLAARIDDVNIYLNSEYVVHKSAELGDIIDDTAYYRNVIWQRERKVAENEKKVNISNELLELINQTHSDRVDVLRFEYNRSNGTIQVNAKVPLETDSAMYVSAISASPLVEAVQYTGYNHTNEGEFSFSVSITLASEEGAE